MTHNLPPTARNSAAGEGRMTPNPASSAVEEEDMGSALEETAAVSQEARPEGQHSAGWQDISTAPSDGRMVLTFGGYREVVTAEQADGEWWRSWGGTGPVPTHWHPFPEPPASVIGPPAAADGNPATDAN
jgi:hypothetical protein